jgi:hypothetical protein
LPTNREVFVLGQPEEDALDWASLMMCATTKKSSGGWTWADRMLKRMGPDQTVVMSGDRIKVLGKAFIEIPMAACAFQR